MALILNGTLGLSDVDGTAATPAIRGTDTNTGIFFPAADQLAASVNGVEGLRLTSTGLGIGTSSPGAKLDVQSSGAGNVLRILGAGAGTYVTNVFENTNAGGYVQHVFNAGAGGASGQAQIGYAPGLFFAIGPVANDTTTPIVFRTNNATERARIDPFGNFLVGTTSAQGRFTLVGSNASSKILVLDTNASFGEVQTYGSVPLYLNRQGNNVITNLGGGSFGVGLDTPTGRLHVDGSSGTTVRVTSANNNSFRGLGLGATPADTAEYASFKLNASSGELRLFVGPSAYGGFQTFYTAGSERMRIDSSGNLLVGTTTFQARVTSRPGLVNNDAFYGEVLSGSTGGGTCYVGQVFNTQAYLAYWLFNGSQVGNINSNGTGTSYNSSSDYRLKNSIAPMTGALARVAALRPVTYKWNVNDSEGQGFIAHELAEVCPDAVTGQKDAVDAEGRPVYQGIDTSFLVATLAAAIQEQQAMIETLKADIANLKGQA